MKIRTDFVTNSSSVSTAEIVIDNPMLLEILQRYKDLGAFGESPFFGIGEYVSGNEVPGIKTPAFQFSEALYGEGWATVTSSPKTLDEVLGEIIAIISDSTDLNKELIAQMKEELRQKEAEINKNYSLVYWSSIQEGEDEPEVIGGKFTYDQENGEKYIGYGSTEVMIDNPILVEILQKYQDLGTFYPEPGFSIENYEDKIGLSHPPYEVVFLAPNLYAGEGVEDDPYRHVELPHNLNEIVGCILDSLEVVEEPKGEDLFQRMKAELIDRHDELVSAYRLVDWKSLELLLEDVNNFYKDRYEGYVEESCEFVFDPIKGEDFHYIRKAGPGWDKRVDEGFIFGEQHIVNGKVLIDFGCEEEDEEEDDEEDEEYDE